MGLESYIAFHNRTTRQLRETGTLGDTPCLIAAIQDIDAAPDAEALDTVRVGGFGDRLKGIVMAFLLAVATDRYFLIHWPVPVPLDTDYAPAAIDWRYNAAQLPLPDTKLTVSLVDADYTNTKSIFAEGDINTDLFQDRQFVVTHGNAIRLDLAANPRYRARLDASFPGLDWGDTAHRPLFHAVMQRLFRYAPQRPEILSLYKANSERMHSKPYCLGIQYRTGGDGSWSDPSIDSLDNYHRIIRIAVKFLQLRQPADYLIYMATDSDAVKERVIKDYGDKLNFLWIDQPAVHIHLSGAAAKTGASFVYLEHSLLRQCDDLVIGWGGFGLTAAWWENKIPFMYMSKDVDQTLDELIARQAAAAS